jgi:MFS transporter, DHA2 family, multidrug resistance protein
MTAPSIFYSWVPNVIRIPVLVLLFFVPLDLNGVYQGNTIDIYSDLGIYAETYTAAYNAVYIGMGLGFMIHMRLTARFPVKTLILFGLTIQLLMNIVCALSGNPLLTIVACLILGFAKCGALIELYGVWAAIWSDNADRSRIYPFVFTLALAGTFVLFWGMAKLAFLYNWQYAYVWVIACILVAIVLVLWLFERHPIHRPLPLYQMDWLGVGLLALLMMLINYIGVYGQVEDWLNSPTIRFALLLLPVTGLGFVLREVTVRRPVLPLVIFRIRNYVPGLLLFLTTGLYFPAVVQFFYSQRVLHFELVRGEELNLYLVPGVLIGAVWSRLWYQFRWSPLLLVGVGMAACLVYNILFYRHLAGVEGLHDFWLPSVFKGMGLIILYISLGIQTTINAPHNYSLTALGFMITIRSFVARGLFTAGFTYLLYAGQVRHLSSLAGWLDPGWRYRWNGGATGGGYDVFMQRQAYLSAAKDLTGQVTLLGGAIILALLLWSLARRWWKFS